MNLLLKKADRNKILVLDRRFDMWTTNIIKTPRGKFEYFLKEKDLHFALLICIVSIMIMEILLQTHLLTIIAYI